jgi:type II secretory pathway pseudopilin PulG
VNVCPSCNTPIPIGALACPQCGRGVTAIAQPVKKRQTLLWVILGCVVAVPIVAGILGILAALIIPNFLDALQKAKQKRALGDLQHAGMMIESYKASHDGAAPAATDAAGLAAALGSASPLPALDPWKRPYLYMCWQESTTVPGCDHYRIASLGRDGKLDGDLREAAPVTFPREQYDHDIIFGDGSFVAAPGAAIGGR